ncbi:MAG: N-acetylmuramoyl-L-alanine amidase [Prevotella sp.]|nr:N-acetylmuramoyl-L-alanine amidase [Prevotella sp.]
MRKKIGLIIAFMALLAMQGLAAGKFVLVIDAGHGGKDPGAIGKTSQEKDLNLKVALAFGSYVEKNCSDVKVIYTRKTDVFVELKERANIANKNKADLFISIHTNALDGGKISRGFETYTLGMHRAADNLNVAKRENSVIFIEKNYKQTYAGFDPNSAESYIMFEILQDKNMANSVELAKLIQSEVCSSSARVNKGVHQAGFLVLRETSMPSCLIEMGFITTPDEETYLNSKEGQDKIAKGIYNAFVKYKKKYGSKMAQNEDGHQLEPSGDMEMKDMASNETGIMLAHGDEDGNGDNEDLPSNSIVEQDDNLYAVTEYAQPRAVRGIGTISTYTNPQDPVPLDIPEENAKDYTHQSNSLDKDVPIVAATAPQAPNDKSRQDSNTPQPVNPSNPTGDKNVLVSVPPQTTDVASRAGLPKVSNQASAVAQTTEPKQKSDSPIVVAQTTEPKQKSDSPIVVAQTTGPGQKPTDPSVVAQTTDPGQKPANPTVVAQTTGPSPKSDNPSVVAQTTDPGRKPTNPSVVAQTTDPGQKPANPTVVAQTTDPGQKPANPTVVAQTTDPGQKPANSTVVAQTTEPSQKPANPTVVAQTTDPGQKPDNPTVVAQTTDPGQKPANPTVVAQTTDPGQKPANPTVVAQTTAPGQKPANPTIVAQTTAPGQKPANPTVVAQTTVPDQKSDNPSAVAQTTKPGQKPTDSAIVAQTTDSGQNLQGDTPTRFHGLPEVTAPPQGTILEGRPIFKVQIAATTEPKNVNSEFFHGVKGVDAYVENGLVKYTVGATDNFAEVENLRNTLLDKFPGAFIIAFRDGYKIPLPNAIREYRKQQ